MLKSVGVQLPVVGVGVVWVVAGKDGLVHRVTLDCRCRRGIVAYLNRNVTATGASASILINV